VTEYVKAHLRQIVAIAATLVIVVPLAWMWQASRMPGSYSVMDMGYVDAGGGPVSTSTHHGDHAGTISVSDLVEDTDRVADEVVELTANQGTVTLDSGRTVEGYTFNGTSPGPTIEATEGDLLEVRVHNEDVEDGISVHWHGVDVPNAEDGVAGVTQDAIGVGEDHVYRFVVDDPGSYWYHSHQMSHEQVIRGLFGPLVVKPAEPDSRVDVLAVTHTYNGTRTLNGEEGDVAVDASPGQLARIRVVNTDNGAVRVWTGCGRERRPVRHGLLSNRSAGSLAIARTTTSSRAGGRPGTTVDGRGGGRCTWAYIWAGTSSPSNGRRPVSTSYSRQPSE